VGRIVRQGNRGDHECDRRDGGNFIHQGNRSLGAEKRLAGAAEGRADVRTLAVLQQDDNNEKKANNYVNDSKESGHLVLVFDLTYAGKEVKSFSGVY